MADIRTISQEFSTSGSLKNPEQILIAEELNYPLQEIVIFLQTKIDELITEVNILKNS